MKRFNYTGTCILKKHYMVDISTKLAKIKKNIDFGEYFTINRPRQYGKTTTIYLLEENLKDNYILISTSFEGVGDLFFQTEQHFCKLILSQFFKGIITNDEDFKNNIISENKNISSFKELSQAITNIIKQTNKKVVLFIDEVDKASNYTIFLNFLGMLRSKYLLAIKNRDFTFHSVVLAGVHDIKNIKMKIRDKNEIEYNSPWNIAIDFNLDMSFSAKEISTMLVDYENDHKIGMNIELISERLYEFTSGYPYLVSKLCYLMDEVLDENFTEPGLEEAVKIILNENNTLFDDLIKNINKYDELHELLEQLILDGKEITYNFQAHNLGVMYGIIKEGKNHKLKVDNKIFEILLYNYLIAKREFKKGVALSYKYKSKFVDDNGNLNLELILQKFQELMKAEYRKVDEKFVEREGRLLFLSFIKPIINGVGFYFVEPETRESNRMDIVITYNKQKFIIELKIWRGGQYEKEGREQLSKYLDAQTLDKGYMIFFNFNKNKKYEQNNLKVNDKEIFEITV